VLFSGRTGQKKYLIKEESMKGAFRRMVVCTIGMTVLFNSGCAKRGKPSVQKIPVVLGAGGTVAATDTVYTLANANGMQAKILNYGGTVVSLLVPDRNGRLGDVVLGFDDPAAYRTSHPFFGVIVGRYGNRIAKGKFKLDGIAYVLAKNNGPNHLHGGLKGFDKQGWTAEPFAAERGTGVRFSYTSLDGEQGYPGTLKATVTYTLTDSNTLRIDYEAVTDKPTVVNLTNHSYFNLSAGLSPDILNHDMTIFADRITAVDKGLIPTGELRPVEGTPFDFREPRKIGDRINDPDDQIQKGGGYDHNFVLNGWDGTLRTAAAVYDSASGRLMEVATTEPGMQFYTGNFLDGTVVGRGGAVYHKRAGFCLETQHFPDSPNKPKFPSTVLRPGETYRTTTVYRFSVR
jgi:aldose 1-epimerase